MKGQRWRPWRRKVDFVPQMETTECGAAALAMVLAHHGHHVPLSEARRACGISRDGASALALVQAGRERGLEAWGVRAEPGQLGALPLPAILHWDFNHFVVLERVERRGLVLVDPACGRRRVGWEEAGRRFTGAALVFQPTPRLELRPRTRPSLAKYRQVFRAHLPALALVFLAMAGLEIVGLVFPVANQLLLDRVLVPRQEAWLWGLVLGLVLAVLARAVLDLARARVVMGLQAAVNAALMEGFLGHLLRLPLGFFLLRDPGDLVQRAQSLGELQDLLGAQGVATLLDAFLLLGFGGLMFAYHPPLALWVVGLSLVQSALMAAFWNRNRLFLATGLAAQGREGAALLEAVTGLEATKACGAEGRMVRRWAHRRVERINNDLDQQRLGLASSAVLALAAGLGSLLVFGLGGREVLEHRMTLGTFLAFLTLQGLFSGPMDALLSAVLRLQALGAHLRRLDDVLETPGERREGEDPGRLSGDLEVQGAFCGFVPESPVLRGIDARIRAGEKVAIVGPTGAGKSTLARLLLGLHLPDRGSLRFDGKDLRSLDLLRVRRQMGVVLQETFLFDDTVMANLALGGGEPSRERLRWALRMACLEEVIQGLPRGLATRVGENGARLSGGERQRLGLARALVREPAILLLDEATSALDLATERRVHANLAGLGCTRVLIAHRMATVRDADRILVLDSGRIVQEGTFDDLARRPGLFRDLLAEADRG